LDITKNVLPQENALCVFVIYDSLQIQRTNKVFMAVKNMIGLKIILWFNIHLKESFSFVNEIMIALASVKGLIAIFKKVINSIPKNLLEIYCSLPF